jgi:hypothetical protein
VRPGAGVGCQRGHMCRRGLRVVALTPSTLTTKRRPWAAVARGNAHPASWDEPSDVPPRPPL